ncbi:MAG: protein-glutamate O-methyltransferase CheR [Zetaproteobacteria bacterium]|nr:protein-glutamate O-methyltransferase CheR [Zetaproteobacteria bacterium]
MRVNSSLDNFFSKTLPEGGLSRITDAVFSAYGYDFRDYHPASASRRIALVMKSMKITDIDQFIARLIADRLVLQAMLESLSINVTAMFRDPVVYKFLREQVLPRLATYPHIRIWSAGVAGGAEAYSLAIMLKEAGLYERSLIYATDFNAAVLKQAQHGVFALRDMAKYTQNYIEAGGTESFSNYYTTTPHLAHIDPSLKERIIFSTHNLATDGGFNEFHLIMCRNVMIYFNAKLTERALQMFNESLVHFGYLCLGTKENLKFQHAAQFFEPVTHRLKVYKKV